MREFTFHCDLWAPVSDLYEGLRRAGWENRRLQVRFLRCDVPPAQTQWDATENSSGKRENCEKIASYLYVGTRQSTRMAEGHLGSEKFRSL